MWWNWADDPHGQTISKSYGPTIREDPYSANCHQIFENNFFIMTCTKGEANAPPWGTTIRLGAMPNFDGPIIAVNRDAGFAGSTYNVPTNYLETHPSATNIGAAALNKRTWFDQRPVLGDPGPAAQANVTKIGTQLYRASASSTANMQYRSQGFVASTGDRPLLDVSPAQISDTSADNYKFCVVVLAGDCQAGSTPGQVYLNVPKAAIPYVYPTRFASLPSNVRDVHFTQNTHTMDTILQAVSDVMDYNGTNIRRLTSAFSPYKVQSAFWNGRPTPDGLRYYWVTEDLDLIRNELMMMEVPAWPVMDSVSRNTFLRTPLALGGSTGDQVRVRFGYAEFGDPQLLRCHERQVGCMVGAASSTGFSWLDENAVWMPCGGGCTIPVPTLPGRVTYYVIDRRNNGVVNSSPMDVLVNP
jgi:hypothetical protein